ncbi:MAG: YceI family protein [Sediminibacterium sp.]|nr:YceI family protein [Sediminibacterium sp.]
MKFFLSLVISSLFLLSNTDAQKIYATRNGKATFSSPSDDDIKAVNNEVTSRIATNGQVTFSMLSKSFRFKLAEMQEHFNDQYMESNKFPRADFKGNIVNLADVDFSKPGKYKVTVKGDLAMHGVTKNLTVPGTIEVKDGKLIAVAEFSINVKDFNIKGGATDKVTIEINSQYQ